MRAAYIEAKNGFSKPSQPPQVYKLTLDLRSVLADTLACLGGIDNLRAAVAMREDVYKRTRQIFGALHPMTQRRQRRLEEYRAAVAQGYTTVHVHAHGGRGDPNP